ncbi:hypothetical protein M434DRAFT_10064 [Hypoxylon sp. CO27-5]|nr:hypothetical protein M434DRAFT_10064 [Hypoxylon sp. CO27-5]
MASIDGRHAALIELAKLTDFETTTSKSLTLFEDKFRELEEVEDHDSKPSESFVITLAKMNDQAFYEQTGWKLLKWLLMHDANLFANEVYSTSSVDKQHPLHAAIRIQNNWFLDSFLDICKEEKFDIKEILGKCGDNGRTSFFPDISKPRNRTPTIPSHTQPSALPETRLGAFPNNLTDSNKSQSFDPHRVYKQMKDKILNDNEKKWSMADLLTAVDSSGMSPYQIRVRKHNTSMGLGGNIWEREEKFQRDMKNDILKYLDYDISLVKTALYGTEGPEKELFLDMSDFSNPSHDFKGFIADLTGVEPGSNSNSASRSENDEQDDEGYEDEEKGRTLQFSSRKPTTGETNGASRSSSRAIETSTGNTSIEFEDTLFYVRLPDFDNFKESPHEEVRTLFWWLSTRNVRIIKSLDIPDNTIRPICEELLEVAVLKKFEIHRLSWRKLDINLDILTSSGYASKLTDITLYSSGNWSVLYHWISEEGLVRLRGLQRVNIIIVQLDPSHDKQAHEQHTKKSKRYKERLLQMVEKLKVPVKKDHSGFEFNVTIDGKWNFPATQPNLKNELFIPNLTNNEHLSCCHNFLRRLANPRQSGLTEDEKRAVSSIEKKYTELMSGPRLSMPDRRIKVAVIDNGVDRIRASVSKKISKGVSFVTAGVENDNCILPWWMVADPHGTQMASLIEKANPFCQLYIARVGKGRKDILPGNAAKAIHWAIEQKVDVISISWVTKLDTPELKEAIERAVSNNDPDRRPILVFCSTADEGIYSGKVYPANYQGTVSVAATDRYGHLPPTSPGGVSILVPGEDIEADGPSYMEKYTTGTVSGSSVATASAAGIASLALLLLKTFNYKSEEKDFRDYYTEEGIMRIFNRMQTGSHGSTGIQLTELFAKDSKEFIETAETLLRTWQLSEFPRPTKT